MPIYDYRCSGCGRVVEVLVRSTDSGTPRCPSCQGEQMERLPSAGYVARFHASPGRAAPCGSSHGCDMPGSGCVEPGSCCCG